MNIPNFDSNVQHHDFIDQISSLGGQFNTSLMIYPVSDEDRDSFVECIEHSWGLRDSNTGDYEIYVHIPFCQSICSYCPYKVIRSKKSLHQTYIDAVSAEILRYSNKFQKVKSGICSTIYFGGGTPSELNPCLVQVLLLNIKKSFSMLTMEKHPQQISFELHPSTATPDYLTEVSEKIRSVFPSAELRFSMGVQSLDLTLGENLSRKLDTKNIISKINQTIHTLNRTQLNIDLMIGLPDQSIQSFLNDLYFLIDLEIHSITIEITRILPGTPLYSNQKRYKFLSPIEIRQLANQAYTLLSIHNYKRSNLGDNSVWIKLGQFKGLYKSSDKIRLGFGMSAFSQYMLAKTRNTESFSEYLEQIQNKKSPITKGRFFLIEDVMYEYMRNSFLQFRTLDFNLFFQNFDESILTRWGSAIARLPERWVSRDKVEIPNSFDVFDVMPIFNSSINK